jgi:hypothetical protein
MTAASQMIGISTKRSSQGSLAVRYCSITSRTILHISFFQVFRDRQRLSNISYLYLIIILYGIVIIYLLLSFKSWI